MQLDLVKHGKSKPWYVLRQDKLIRKISGRHLKRRENKVRKTNFFQRAIREVKVGEAWQKFKLTCITSKNSYVKFQVNISKANAIEILAMAITCVKVCSNVTKVELGLYYVKVNSYTKFQVDITKEGREKSGKLNFCRGQWQNQNQNQESTEGYSRWKVEKSYGKFGKTGLNNWSQASPQLGGRNQVSEG